MQSHHAFGLSVPLIFAPTALKAESLDAKRGHSLTFNLVRNGVQ